jgi:hypothetical protein
VITRSDLWVLLNVAWTNEQLLDRIDSLADLISDGLLTIDNRGDVHITSVGRAQLLPVLPIGTA